jgi:hypothetical protein
MTTLVDYEQYAGILQSSKTFLPDMDNNNSNSDLLDQISYDTQPTITFKTDANTLVTLQTTANLTITTYINEVQQLVDTLKTSLVAVADVTFLYKMINDDPENLIYDPNQNTVLGVSITQAGSLVNAVNQACNDTTSTNTFAYKLMDALRIVKQAAIAYQTFANNLSVVLTNRPQPIYSGNYPVDFPVCVDIRDYWIPTMNNAIFTTTTAASPDLQSFTKNLKDKVNELVSPSRPYTSNTTIGVLINQMMSTEPNYLSYLSNLDNLYKCAQSASSPSDFKSKAKQILTKFFNNLMNTHLVRINKITTNDPVVTTVQAWIMKARDYVTYLDIKILIHAITGYNNGSFDSKTGFITSYPVIAESINQVNSDLTDFNNYYYKANDNVTIAVLVPQISGDKLGFFPIHQALTDYGSVTPSRNFMKLNGCFINAVDKLFLPVNLYIEPNASNPYKFVSMFSGIELFMPQGSSVNQALATMKITQKNIQDILPWSVWDLNLLLLHSLLLVSLIELKTNHNKSDLEAYTLIAQTLADYNTTFNPLSFTQALLDKTQITSIALNTLSQAITSIEVIATICALLRQFNPNTNYNYSSGDFDTKNSPIIATNIRSIGEQFIITY